MIRILTPASILECVTDDDANPVDCFDRAVPADNPYRTDLIAMLWATYRYRPIASLCLDRWLQMLEDRATVLDRRYTLLIAEYEAHKTDIASIRMGWTETWSDKAMSSATGSDTTVHTSEDIPQTSGAGSDTWLSRRDTDTVSPGTTSTDTDEGTREHIDSSRLNADGYADVMDRLRDPYKAYADEYSSLFLDYYDLEGYICRRARSNSSRCHAAGSAGSTRCSPPHRRA